MSRYDARELAFQLLFQLESREDLDAEQIDLFERYLRNCKASPQAPEDLALFEEDEAYCQTLWDRALPELEWQFLLGLVRGVREKQDELDACLQGFLKEWEIDRLPIVDRCLLRLGAYEILHCPELPDSVSISEAVRLAKIYADELSKGYINAVLGRVAELSRSEELPQSEAEFDEVTKTEETTEA